jgi:hypothetical protein
VPVVEPWLADILSKETGSVDSEILAPTSSLRTGTSLT